jgi:hypothetical protein
MMPCKFCNVSPDARGLKQVGKTRNIGTQFARRYRCQDCNAAMIWSGDLLDEVSFSERWFPPGTFHVPARERGRIRLRPNPSDLAERGNCIDPSPLQAGMAWS